MEWHKRGIEGVCHETIYQWIWDCKKSSRKKDALYKQLYSYLHHGRAKKKRGNQNDNWGTIAKRVPIGQRPKVVEKRERIGDVELELMLSKRDGPPLLVMPDRAKLITKIDLSPSKNAELLANIITDRVLKIGPQWINTMTFDNGFEFARHTKVTELCGVKTYFTKPYTSQDKGSVENQDRTHKKMAPKRM